MQEVLARVMEVDVDDVIKATTTEKIRIYRTWGRYFSLCYGIKWKRLKEDKNESEVFCGDSGVQPSDEVDELLQSLCGQTYQNFEVVVVEDGSAIPCKQVVKKYTEMLDVHYFEKPNSGPGQTRNYAAEHRSREVSADSGFRLYPAWNLSGCGGSGTPAGNRWCVWRSWPSGTILFSDVQKAINYAATSFFTTGGIRGGLKKKNGQILSQF